MPAGDPFQDRISQLRAERARLNARDRDVAQELEGLLLQQARARFTCDCVRLNRDIGVHTVHDQLNSQRKGLTLGLVSDTLSARNACSTCRGTGVPR